MWCICNFLDLDAAYRRACKEGSKEVFLARMNLIGFHEAGKTSLAKRLMGKDFDANEASTEGISLHCIKSTFDIQTHWKEKDITANDLDEEFIEQMKRFQVVDAHVMSNDTEGKQEAMSIASSTHLEPKQAAITTASGSTTEEKVPEITMSSRIKEKLLTLKNTDNSLSAQGFTLRLWDLGGQNDFLTTHHLFLDVGATAVIVMDATKEFKEKFEYPNKNLQLKQNNPSSPEEIMHYWLNAFYAEAKEKKTNIIDNIFIVLTHIDDFDTEDEKEKKLKDTRRRL